MTNANEAENAARDGRERPDLRRQYRPIGIGAVAAALSAAGRSAGDTARDAANSNERSSDPESLAA